MLAAALPVVVLAGIDAVGAGAGAADVAAVLERRAMWATGAPYAGVDTATPTGVEVKLAAGVLAGVL